MPFDTIFSWILALRGWKRNLFAFALGICATAALPPFFVVPLLIPAFTGLFWLLQTAPTPRRAFADGWWWGFGFFTTGLYWMCIALLVDMRFAWLIPFTLIGLNGIIALYPAFAALIIGRLRPAGITGVVVFSIIWISVEFLRGHLFTGFPWNLVGYSWGISDAVAQSASVIGIYGLTFLTILAAAMLGSRSALATAVVWSAFALMTLAGAWRLSHDPKTYVEGVTLRLVQASIPQELKWDPRAQIEGVKEYIALSRSPGFENVTHVIWPETAVPYAVGEGTPIVSLISQAAPKQGALITGSLRTEGDGETWKVWNSLAVVTSEGKLSAVYDKHHLVPFGEFVPFRSILPIDKITPGATDFSRGPGASSLVVPNAPAASPLICYETIFPASVMPSGTRPGWLLNITNDGWFGNSTGPHQHFIMAKFRAVEEGVPLVRVANNGISGIFDAYGKTLFTIPYNHKEARDSGLPMAIAGKTIYGCIGNISLLLLIYVAGIFTLFYPIGRNFNN